MFPFCKDMVEKIDFPKGFRKTILYIIWKQKGPAEVLKNSRFIHMKEALEVAKMKQKILKSISSPLR